jgi:AP-1 complex subunit mu
VEERHKFVAKPPVAVTNAVSWRGEGIKHKKNEIFLDVIEKLNILVSANGTVLRSEILGSLKMKSFLSGMPELKLGLNDKVLMDNSGRADPTKGKSVDLEDIRFHQCVRLSRFENDRTISFIPPDGEFDLMVYRLNTQVRPLLWIEAHVEPHSHSRVEYMIKAKSNFKRRSTANNVEIVIPVPTDADSPAFKCSIGKVEVRFLLRRRQQNRETHAPYAAGQMSAVTVLRLCPHSCPLFVCLLSCVFFSMFLSVLRSCGASSSSKVKRSF